MRQQLEIRTRWRQLRLGNNRRQFYDEQRENVYDLPIVDILLIDTEDHDPAVLQGASELIDCRNIRSLMFEYHGSNIWMNANLGDIVQELDLHDFDCILKGREG